MKVLEYICALWRLNAKLRSQWPSARPARSRPRAKLTSCLLRLQWAVASKHIKCSLYIESRMFIASAKTVWRYKQFTAYSSSQTTSITTDWQYIISEVLCRQNFHLPPELNSGFFKSMQFDVCFNINAMTYAQISMILSHLQLAVSLTLIGLYCSRYQATRSVTVWFYW